MKRACIAVLLLPISASAGTMYKCTVGGHTSFQDRPCEGSGAQQNKLQVRPVPMVGTVPVRVAPEAGAADDDSKLKELQEQVQALEKQLELSRASTVQPVCHRPTENAIRSAIFNNRVLTCMTIAEVLQAAGKYSEHQVCYGGVNQAWFFPRRIGDFPATVRFENGYLVQYGDTDCFGLGLHGR